MTGHRPNKLPAESLAALSATLATLIQRIDDNAQAVAAKHGRLLGARVRLVLLSSLAEGADRMAAEKALEQGWQLQCPLPFERGVYSQDFIDAASRAEFERLASAAYSVFELDGKRGSANGFGSERAYESAGLMMLEASDLIIAVWDGKVAEGIGGTAVVVERALRDEVPVLLINPTDPSAAKLMWTGFEPLPPSNPRIENLIGRAPDAHAAIAQMIEGLLAPPTNEVQIAELDAYLDEKLPSRSLAITYPIFLKLVAGPERRREAPPAAPRPALPSDSRLAPAIHTLLQPTYATADRLALHYARSYRSAFIFNYVAAAAAVALALGGLFVHEASTKAVLVLLELVLIASILFNTWIGQWMHVHGRWLDYRRLAERLRQMQFLPWSGASSRIPRPVARSSAIEDGGGDWVDWYARSMRRGLPLPNAVVNGAYLERCATALGQGELAAQIAYHRSSAHLMERVDERLHRLGDLFFWLTAATCGVYLAAFGLHLAGWTAGLGHDFAAVVTGLTALLPTLGAAAKAIRAQGDFKTIAERSLATADELEVIARSLTGADGGAPSSMALLADRTEKASAAMMRDLVEWRMHSETRPLALPA